MAFGPIMTIPNKNHTIILAPFEREDSLEFINPGMQQMGVTKYLSRRSAPVTDDEYEWYESIRKAKDNVIWGVWLEHNKTRELVGVTELMEIRYSHVNQATSGIQISKPEYWGMGIASLAHRARTWYAFEQMGLHRVKSAVIHGNIASRKALEKVGYTSVYTERNDMFVDGQLRHTDCLELLNPAETFWAQWWGSDTPGEEAAKARERTVETLQWCEKHLRT